MITFACPHCAKRFSVPDEAGGKSGTCKACNTRIVVPRKGDEPSAAIMLEAVSAPAPRASRPAPTPTPVDPSASSDPFAPVDPFGANDPFAGPDPFAGASPFVGADPFAPSATGGGFGSAAPSPSVRGRRLKAEAEQIAKAFAGFAPISVLRTFGDPPDRYQIQYRIRGLQRGPNGQPVLRDDHAAEFTLTRDYPRVGPKCTMLTPIFHPNIEPATICVGDHWTAGQRLVDVILRVGEMIAYQSYNVKSPLDGEAAMWADLNRARLPVDRRDLMPPNLE